MKRLRTALVTGLLVLVPIVLTIDIFLWFVGTIDRMTRNYLPTFYLPFDFKGLGLALGLIIVIVTGFLTQNFIGIWFISLLDTAVKRVPLGGGVYSAIKQFLETVFSSSRSEQFKGAVLVQFPRKGVYSIGFRTGTPDALVAKHLPKKTVNVFVPCTPNPTSGFYLLVEEEDLIPLEMSVQEAFKIVISMGIVRSETEGVTIKRR